MIIRQGGGADRRRPGATAVTVAAVIVLALTAAALFLLPTIMRGSVRSGAVPEDVIVADGAVETTGINEYDVYGADQNVEAMLAYAKRLVDSGNTEAAARVYDLLEEAILRDARKDAQAKLSGSEKVARIVGAFDAVDLYNEIVKEASGK